MKKAKARVFAVANQKGGVSKTTTAINLGAAFRKSGKRVLLIDADPQHDLSRYCGVEAENGKNLLSFFDGQVKLADLIQNIEKGLDIVPGAVDVMELDQRDNVNFDLSGVSSDYDFIIIDCSPYLNGATLAAMRSADGVIVTTTPDFGSAENIEEISASLKKMKKKIYGIVVTRYAARMLLNQSMLEKLEGLARRVGTRIFKSKIRESVAIRESQLVKKDIFSYSPRSAAATDYKALAAEIVKGEK